MMLLHADSAVNKTSVALCYINCLPRN